MNHERFSAIAIATYFEKAPFEPCFPCFCLSLFLAIVFTCSSPFFPSVHFVYEEYVCTIMQGVLDYLSFSSSIHQKTSRLSYPILIPPRYQPRALPLLENPRSQ